MAILTVRGLDPVVQAKLRERAARHGRSMEAEARAVLSEAVLRDDDPVDLVALIREHFSGAAEEIEWPTRDDYQRPIDLPS